MTPTVYGESDWLTMTPAAFLDLETRWIGFSEFHHLMDAFAACHLYRAAETVEAALRLAGVDPQTLVQRNPPQETPT